ncbi:MAG TPA: segregation/condensation protein A [bacterium]|nr:segregation/condensation protein A [bacterium]
METYTIKLPQFEGPLDLLLSLAQQGQVDLLQIPLGQIAEDYLSATRGDIDLEQATEVLWTLAAMIEMKSRLLVPKPEPSEAVVAEDQASDLQERLEERLGEYRSFKEVATALRALEDYQKRVFSRTTTGDPEAVVLEGVTIDDLFRAFQRVLERAREDVREIAAEEIKVADRMDTILALLAAHPEGVEFAALFGEASSTLEVIVTFLALLELIKDRRVRAQQAGTFAPITLAVTS